MKTMFHAWAMCQSMFCALPFPGHIWDERARDKMLRFLPLIGLEIGVVWALVAWLCEILGLPAPVRALILATYPYVATGALHLDGYMDVTDAVRSWREPERRREILKDSHVGSFAVIGVVLLLLTQYALMASVPAEADWRILIFIPAVSRCGSALAVTGLKPMSTSQYAQRNRSGKELAFHAVFACILVLSGFLLCGKYGFALLGCAAGYGVALVRAYRSLEGMNGDVAGYALTIGEVWAVAVYALI